MRRRTLIDAALTLGSALAITATLLTGAAHGAPAHPMSGSVGYAVSAPFRTLWTAQRSTLGLPTSGVYSIPGATVQNFQGGRMYRGANGQVIALSTRELSGLTPPNGAVAYALDQLGDGYLMGATGPDQWDCSALTQRAYAFGGRYLPRTSAGQHAYLPVVSAPMPGDILWWPGHVGIYLGVRDGRQLMVNATWHRYGGMWRKGVLTVDPTTRDDAPAYAAQRNPLR